MAWLDKAVLTIGGSLISSLVKIGLKLDELETFLGGWGWVVGSSGNKANLAQLVLKLGISLAKTVGYMSDIQCLYRHLPDQSNVLWARQGDTT